LGCDLVNLIDRYHISEESNVSVFRIEEFFYKVSTFLCNLVPVYDVTPCYIPESVDLHICSNDDLR
jgi:hypothetical protein